MMTLAYIIVSILLGAAVLVGFMLALAVWGAVMAARPELLDKNADRADDAAT